jgi:type VI secretion system protein ImpM
MTAELEIGWFGKLPSAGDFVFRRIPRSLLDALDSWLSRGLADYRVAMPNDWRTHFAAAAPWNCAIPACVGGGTTLIGLIVPSRDRVGREFPLCAGVALPPDAATNRLLADVPGWLSRLGQVVVEARDRGLPLDEFDANIRAIALPPPAKRGAPVTGGNDILDILGLGPIDAPTVPMPLAHAVPWPELPMIFDAEKPTSFWWTNPGPGVALSGFTTDLGLDPSLLIRLMGPVTPRIVNGS